MSRTRLVLLAAAIALSLCTSASAQWDQHQWAQRLFTEPSHNFGMVARGAAVEHVFSFQNTLATPIVIQSARVSCRCTTPVIETYQVQPGETGRIKAVFNTTGFQGQRGATITVVFSQPSWAEVQLRVDGYIRTDIVTEPGEVNFGDVPAGETLTKTIKIKYAGNPQWQIREIQSSNPHIVAVPQETRRENGRVDYDVTVTVTGDQPPGYLQSELMLVTTNRETSVPIRVQGYLRPGIEAPSIVDFGTFSTGEVVERPLMLKSDSDFTIVEASTSSPGLSIKVDAEGEKKKVHYVSLTYSSTAEGPLTAEIIVKTDSPSSPTKTIRVTGNIEGSR
jgi:hypothetical protein